MNSYVPNFHYEPRPLKVILLYLSDFNMHANHKYTANTNPIFTDCATLSESQMEASAAETANLLLSLSQGNQHIENI